MHACTHTHTHTHTHTFTHTHMYTHIYTYTHTLSHTHSHTHTHTDTTAQSAASPSIVPTVSNVIFRSTIPTDLASSVSSATEASPGSTRWRITSSAYIPMRGRTSAPLRAAPSRSLSTLLSCTISRYMYKLNRGLRLRTACTSYNVHVAYCF